MILLYSVRQTLHIQKFNRFVVLVSTFPTVEIDCHIGLSYVCSQLSVTQSIFISVVILLIYTLNGQ